ncbi:MAG: PHP domain-containing protein [Candidatus Lokiarchaeota archaeon]|nr:PHP domain-containing protein [Candidatus Lokiarchaeota archaeon]
MKTESKIGLAVWPLSVPAILLVVLRGQGWLGLLGDLLAYCLFLTVAIYTCVYIALAGPRPVTFKAVDWLDPENQFRPSGYDEAKSNVLLDTHAHTRHSDGSMTVEECAAWHVAMGFSAFFVTDHDTMANADDVRRIKEKYKGRILVMQGLEIATERGHVNVLGLKDWDFARYKGLDPDERIRRLVADAHAQGAVVSINHFPWSTGGSKPRWKPGTHLTRDRAVELGFDLMEVANWDDEVSAVDDASIEFCKQHAGTIAPVVATDVHQPDKDRLYGWTLLHVDELTEEAIMAELRARRTGTLIVPGGIPYPCKHPANPLYTIVRPLADIGRAIVSLHRGGRLSDLDWKGVAAWLGHALLLFAAIELLVMLR